jgi:hypothetical protein
VDGSPRGPLVPADATRLELDAKGSPVLVTASVKTTRGDFAQILLGQPGLETAKTLRAPVPAEARGGRIVSLTISPRTRVQERGGEGRPLDLDLRLGELAAETESGDSVSLGSYDGWMAVNGIEARTRPGGVALAGTITEQLASRFRPRQPSDDELARVIASPAVAAAAGPGGELPLRIAGEQVVVRVAAVASHFPGAGADDFVVADRALLGTALNAQRPGIAVPNELWLGTDARERPELAGILARPPFHVLTVQSREQAEASLRHDPLARGTLLTLLAGALVALGLALVGILLGVLSDVRDERGELDDLEAQGARPALLRRVVRLRSLVVVAAGLLGGLITAAALAAIVVDLVTVTADAATTGLPLRTAVDWPVLAAALAAGALAAAALVTAASRRI